MIDLTMQTAQTIAEAIRRRELSAVAVTESALEQIARLNPTLHAFITVAGDRAVAAAKDIDKKVASGQAENLPLGGRAPGGQGQLLDQGYRRRPGARNCSRGSCRKRMQRPWPG